ncbi:MAG: hypothetical protein ABEJ57_03020 [Halobacteriaceae archaeon]
MAGQAPRTGPLTLASGIVVVVGGILVVVSLVWETVTIGATVVDVFQVGGAIFAVGFALGGVDRWQTGQRRRGVAQVVSAVGWAGFVWGTSGGPTVVLFGGLVLLAIGGLVLVGADEWLDRVL